MLTFGHGRGFQNAQMRLAAEARRTGLFDHVYNYSDFPKFIREDPRWARHMEHLDTGMGYWFWKAPLIKHIMKRMQEGDLLLYVDSGSEFGFMKNFEGVARALCNHDLVTFALKQSEVRYTKGDLFAQFGVRMDDKTYSTNQILATYFVIKNTKASREFIDVWERLSENIHLIDDSKSFSPDHATFQEHRRDQSIFSMLVKANKPDIAVDQQSHFPYAAESKRHSRLGVPGLRPLIMSDPGYPRDPAHSWMVAARNHFGERRFKEAEATRLTRSELDYFKTLFSRC